MQTLKKWIETPVRRLGTSFLIIVGGAFLSFLFPPFAVISFLGVAMLLMLGQQVKFDWSEGKQIDCPICCESTTALLVKQTNYMYPIIPFVGRDMSIPIGNCYYLVCDRCLQTHVGKQELSTIVIIARGGLAHAKEITPEEYNALTK